MTVTKSSVYDHFVRYKQPGTFYTHLSAVFTLTMYKEGHKDPLSTTTVLMLR